ncbi:MAG: hypothetical protein CBC48_13675 [bacterium TMED88]|nr:hypothetical protein [Deltaproteobacteria bacterium]OUV28036.1 MAG: hypothetical protein CBC48_13675 [bacterium TMED88]
MAGLRPAANVQQLRARRWDAIVLGSSIYGLVAAARLGAAGHRVLVVEEERAQSLHPALREPFFLAGSRDEGVLDACLRELHIPLIDRRRISPEPLAWQIVGDDFRMDLGSPKITHQELATWGFCEEEQAGQLVRTLTVATDAERQVMLEAPIVRMGRRLGRAWASGLTGSHHRGLPAEARDLPPPLARALAGQIEALSNLAHAEPSPEAWARLLGTGLAGGAGFGERPPWLHGLLRRRVEAVHGEFRTLPGRFELVEVDHQPGIVAEKSSDLWLGRALLIASTPSALVPMLTGGAPPDFLDRGRARCQRLAVHLRADREVVPAGMCARLVLLPPENPETDKPGQREVISLSAFPASEGGEGVDLIARIRLRPGHEEDPATEEILRRIERLMPFSEGRVVPSEQLRPLWDDDGLLEDPEPGRSWPSEIDLRVSGRTPVYRLDRAGVAGLGLEGDLLLGWRAGDAVAADIS